MARPANRYRILACSLLAASGLIAVLAFELVRTAPVRESVRAYTALITAANKQDQAAAAGLCTERYRRTHSLAKADEGGLIGLPRNVHKNFQAWRQGSEVRLCPTNRIGPVYRFIRERGSWRFDGPVGLLMPGGRVEPMEEQVEAPRA